MKKKILYLLTTYLLYGTQNIQSFRPFIPIFFHFKCVVFHVTQLCNFVHIVQLHDNFQVSNDYEKKLTKITRLFTYICLWSRNFFVYLLTEVSDHFFLDHLRYKKRLIFFPFQKKMKVLVLFAIQIRKSIFQVIYQQIPTNRHHGIFWVFYQYIDGHFPPLPLAEKE